MHAALVTSDRFQCLNLPFDRLAGFVVHHLLVAFTKTLGCTTHDFFASMLTFSSKQQLKY